MRRILLVMALTAAGAASEAWSQSIAPGSTAPGDYLRGVGIEAAGLGVYNFNTARAEAIQADTSIRVDQYVREVLRQGRASYAAIRQQARERFDANFAAIRKRISEHPEAFDVMTGNALNAILDQLNDPHITESAFRLSPARLAIEDIRQIPFRLGEKGVSFSMGQLTVRGKGKWPVAFQDEHYALERKAYARALDTALEHMVDRKMPDAVIEDYKTKVEAFAIKLRAEPWLAGDRRRIEATLFMVALTKTIDLLKLHQVHGALAELDSYGGRDVNDLRRFMQRHNLRFAPAESIDERSLYPRLYESLVAVRESVLDQGKGQDK